MSHGAAKRKQSPIPSLSGCQRMTTMMTLSKQIPTTCLMELELTTLRTKLHLPTCLLHHPRLRLILLPLLKVEVKVNQRMDWEVHPCRVLVHNRLLTYMKRCTT